MIHHILPAIWTSLFVSVTATLACAVAGIPLAVALAMKRAGWRESVVALLNTLLALPTVVVGLVVYSIVRRGSVLGPLDLLFTPSAIIMGLFVLGLPIMATFVYTAVSGLPSEARDTARALGAGRVRVAAVALSEARYGVAAAVAATFGRLVGEVGIAMMLGGNIAGYTRTMTTAIALETSKGEFERGLALGAVLLVVALSVNFVIKYFQGRSGE